MRPFPLLTTAAVLLISLLGGVPARAQDPGPVYKDQIVLPIEVVGADGFTQTVSFYTGNSLYTRATRLYLQIENLRYATMASVKLNNGSYVALNNTNCQVMGQGKAWGGIGGQFRVLKLTMDLSLLGSLANGTNTLTFKFVGTDGVSSGYRVIGINLRDAGGADLLSRAAFRWDDVTKWSGPYADATNIAAGQTLWTTASLIEEPGGGAINAKCMDCHAKTGFDLKYFNFSNRSIIARSEFHGLSNTQGKQIASYIRSLPSRAPYWSRYGRPWNPPFQPGPGLDSRPGSDWAAGAGIQWALENDGGMLPYLYPNGISAAAHDSRKTLNLRELPTPLQYQTWNGWLPQYWPGDSYPTQFVNSAYQKGYDGTGSDVFTLNLKTDIPANIDNPATEWQTWKYLAFLGQWGQKQDAFLTAIDNAGFHPSNSVLDVEKAERWYAQKAWQTMKLWELNQENQLWRFTNTYEAAGSPRSSYSAEKRIWPTGFIYFDNAPHKQGIQDAAWGAQRNAYLNNFWYTLAPTVDAGNRNHSGASPIDWNYTLSFIVDLSGVSVGRPAICLHSAITLKSFEQGDNGKGVGEIYGWVPSAMRITPLWANTSELPQTTTNELRCAVTRDWITLCRRFTRQAYIDGGAFTGTETLNPSTTNDESTMGSSIFSVLNNATNYNAGALPGVDQKVINDLATMGAEFWPTYATQFNTFKR
jgi:hypothetical protein